MINNILIPWGAETIVYIRRKKKKKDENKHFPGSVFRNAVPILACVDWILLSQLECSCYMLREKGEAVLCKHFKATIEFL